MNSQETGLEAHAPRWVAWSIAATLLAGCLLRTWYLLARGSLWVDETFLAVNLVSRDLRGLLAPLDYDQVAPPLYLALMRGVVVTLGHGDIALRLPALVAGILVLALAMPLARRLLPGWPGLVFVALLAFSPILVRYSTEAKAYAFDPLATMALLLATVRVLERPGDGRRWLALGTVGTAALLLSTAAPLLVAASGAALIATPVTRRPPGIWRMLGTFVFLMGVFAAIYLLFYRGAAESGYMQRFYQAGFLVPGSAAFAANLRFAVREIAMDFLLGRAWVVPLAPLLVIVAGLVLVGMLGFWRRLGPGMVLLLCVPGLAAMAASAVCRWPIMPRTMLFTWPHLALLVAGGVSWLASRPGRAASVIGAMGGGILVASPLRAVLTGQFVFPHEGRAGKLVAEFQRAHGREPAYIAPGGLAGWVFYSTEWGEPEPGRAAFFAQVFRARDGGSSRGRPVQAPDGWDFVWRGVGRVELVSDRSGMEWRHVTGYSQPAPDPGWAANEARRIAAQGGSDVWMVGVTVDPEPTSEVTRALERAGYVATDSLGDGRTRFTRYVSSAGTP